MRPASQNKGWVTRGRWWRPRNGGGVHFVIFRFLFLWCLLPCRSFYINTHPGVVTPHDPFVFVGDNVTLTCNLTEPGLCGPLFFKVQGKRLDSQYVETIDKKSIRLHYPLAEALTPRMIFACYCQRIVQPDHNSIVNSQYVHVDYPAAELQNLHCTAKNWADLECSWELPHPYFCPECLSVDVTLWKEGDEEKRYAPSDSNDTWAVWTDGQGGYLWGVSYVLKASVVYIRDHVTSNKTTSFPIRTRSVVKPYPLLEKFEIEERTANSLRVRVHHSDMSHQKTMHVEYSSHWNPHKWIKREIPWRETDGAVALTELRPFTNYTLKVAVGPGGKDSGWPSDWRHFVFQTLPTAPEVPPELCPGCYSVTSFNQSTNQCLVRLFWQSIPPMLRNNHIEGYQLLQQSLAPNWTAADLASGPGHCTSAPLSSDSSEVEEQHSNTPGTSRCAAGEEGLLDPAAHSAQVTVDAGRDSLVWLTARTPDGLCSRCSRLFVPSAENRTAPVKELEVEVVEDVTTGQWDGLLHVSWADPPTGPHASQQVVVVWCPGVDQSCHPGQEIQWKQVPAEESTLTVNVSSHDLDVVRGPDGVIVGVVRLEQRLQEEEEEQGDVSSVSSGIQWTPCIFRRNRAPKVGPKVTVSQAGPGKLHVAWTYNACEGGVHVQHFDIVYCLASDTPDDDFYCLKEERMQVGRKERKEVMLEGLEGGRKYRVRVVAVAASGKKRSAVHLVVAPAAVAGISGVTVVQVVSILFVAVLIGLALLCCIILGRRYKKTSGEFPKSIPNLAVSTENIANKEQQAWIPTTTTTTTTTRPPAHMDKQLSVNSETPLLTQETPRGEAGLENVLHQHPDTQTAEMELLLEGEQQQQKHELHQDHKAKSSTSTQGECDSGVGLTLPHCTGEAEEEIAEKEEADKKEDKVVEVSSQHAPVDKTPWGVRCTPRISYETPFSLAYVTRKADVTAKAGEASSFSDTSTRQDKMVEVSSQHAPVDKTPRGVRCTPRTVYEPPSSLAYVTRKADVTAKAGEASSFSDTSTRQGGQEDTSMKEEVPSRAPPLTDSGVNKLYPAADSGGSVFEASKDLRQSDALSYSPAQLQTTTVPPTAAQGDVEATVPSWQQVITAQGYLTSSVSEDDAESDHLDSSFDEEEAESETDVINTCRFLPSVGGWAAEESLSDQE